MGSVLCCVEADPAPTYENGDRAASPRVVANFTMTLRRLQEHGSLHARQYAQYRCGCDAGSCPRQRDVRTVVDAYISSAPTRTPATDGIATVPYADALKTVVASLATFDEGRRHGVALVRATHRALVASDGDEALAFALVVETALVAAPPA